MESSCADVHGFSVTSYAHVRADWATFHAASSSQADVNFLSIIVPKEKLTLLAVACFLTSARACKYTETRESQGEYSLGKQATSQKIWV